MKSIRKVLLLLIVSLTLVLSACSNEETETTNTSSQETDTEAVTEADDKSEDVKDMDTETSMEEDKEDTETETDVMVDEEDSKTEFTTDELAAFDGKDGNKAYVAIDGVVYDVTDVPAWQEGIHNGNMAGKDLTAAIAEAPHGTSKLNGLPIVGDLVD